MEALHTYDKGFSIDVDDEIGHYVYHVGYRLLMLSYTLESFERLPVVVEILYKDIDQLNLYSTQSK
ncbi:hypothetical protein I4U23_011352 [Adineta vaga]|nr:hypothetical protein I4U23_011352 [Adineta vaga]